MLDYYRNCDIQDDDVDVAVSASWLTDNHEKLKQAFKTAGFYQHAHFGHPGEFGYEFAVMRSGFKVDVFSVIEYETNATAALWVSGVVYPCPIKRLYYQIVDWAGVPTRVAAPMEQIS